MGHPIKEPKDIKDLPLYIPYEFTRMGDGTFMVIPGRPVTRATLARTAKLTGVHPKTLHKLADCGLVRRQQPSPNVSFFFPGEVEAFLKRTQEDDGFWNEVRKRAYLRGKCLRDAR